jgi:hypothetical protein
VSLATWALTTLPELKGFLGLDVSTFDSQLERCIDEVSARMNIYCARHLKSTTYEKVITPTASDTRIRLDGGDDMRLRLPEAPLTTLSGIVHLYQGVETAINLTYAEVDYDAGIITLAADIFPAGNQNILVSCTAGYKSGTHDMELAVLRRACNLWCATWWLEQKNAVSGAIEVEGIKLPTEDPSLRVASLLDPFVWRTWG